ncbi:MAG: peroxiredoxin [Actinomycetota bacterium]
METFRELQPNLPAPIDDGACDRLLGTSVPDMTLPSTSGERISLRQRTRHASVLYFYPRTGVPGQQLPDGWDLIPGARGCTPQACGFRDHAAELEDLGAQVLGISAQPTDEQREFAERIGLPFSLLSDPALLLAEQMGLPTFEVGSMRLFKRVTLIAKGAKIVKVFYPIFPPDRNAGDVVAWLKTNEMSR